MVSLRAIYALLHAHFGPLTGPAARRPWWPLYGADPPFEILVGAVLVQQTRWETVEAAVLRLLAHDLLRPQALATADAGALAAHIRPAAFHTQKAPGLIAIARHLVERYAGSTARLLAQPTAPLRHELLALPRIGPETCDVVLLYGGGHPVFVVDEYTRRLFERVGPPVDQGPKTKDQDHENASATTSRSALNGSQNRITSKTTDWRRSSYEAVRLEIEQQLARDTLVFGLSSLVSMYAEYHAQINEVCVRYCLARPRCDGPPARRVYTRQEGRESYHGREDGCPLRPVCRYYKSEGD